MMLMIFTVVGVLIIIAGLYAKYVVLPVKYVLITGDCKEFGNRVKDISKCKEVDKFAEGSIMMIRPDGIIYNADPSGITNGIITLGSLITIICALIYAYKKFVSKK